MNDENDENKESNLNLEKVPLEGTPYVTKKLLIIALIITVILSSAGGAFITLLITNGSSQSTSSSDFSNLTISNSTGSEKTVQEIVALNENAVVEINTKSISTSSALGSIVSEGAGSGIIVKETGYIVTNYHVISDSGTVTVTLHNGEEYSAQIIGTDKQNDIAVIKIAANNLDTVTIGDSSKLSVGDLAVAIGNPLGKLGGTATAGIISALDRQVEIDGLKLDLLQTDAAINRGNSGGGLFGGDGTLIGIVNAKSSGTDVEGLAFAIPVNSVTDVINDLIENGKVTNRPMAGIMIYDLDEATANSYKLSGAGVYIKEITGANAKEAGLKAGDKILSFNGTAIESSDQLITAIQGCAIGEKVTFKIERKGKKKTISFKLQASEDIDDAN